MKTLINGLEFLKIMNETLKLFFISEILSRTQFFSHEIL